MANFLLTSRWTTWIALIPGALLWEAVGRAQVTRMIPPLSQVVADLPSVYSDERFLSSLRDSLSVLVIGYIIAVLGGVALGLLLGAFRPVDWALGIYVQTLQGAPKAALLPVLILIFGIGRSAILATVILFSIFPVLLNTVAGVRAAPEPLRVMAHSFGATRLNRFWQVIIPSASPLIVSGAKYAAARSVQGLIIGEQLLAVVGLGALIQRYGGSFQVTRLYATILFVGTLGLVAAAAVGRIEKRVLVRNGQPV